MLCINCSSEISAGARVCPHCRLNPRVYGDDPVERTRQADQETREISRKNFATLLRQRDEAQRAGKCPACLGSGKCWECAGHGEVFVKEAGWWFWQRDVFRTCHACQGGRRCTACHGTGHLGGAIPESRGIPEAGDIVDWDGNGPCVQCGFVFNMKFDNAVCPSCGHWMSWQEAFQTCATYPG
jgi:hypothetical protein